MIKSILYQVTWFMTTLQFGILAINVYSSKHKIIKFACCFLFIFATKFVKKGMKR